MNELGIDLVTLICFGNLTYENVNITEGQLIKEHIDIMKDKFKIKCTEKDHVIKHCIKLPVKPGLLLGHDIAQLRNCL